MDRVDGGELCLDNLGQHGVHLLVLLELRLLVVRGILQFGLEGAGEGDDGPAAVRLNPLVNLHQPLVLLALEILLGQVDGSE